MNFYSQGGEDRWIVENLKLPEKGVFVEVGAYDGIVASNTLHFEEKGWTGLAIEPDREMAAKCLKNRRCDVVCCAIGCDTGPATFFVNNDDKGLSGLKRQGVPTPTSVMRLGDLLYIHEISDIDILSIDTEGTEIDVWRSMIGYNYCAHLPKIVIVEYDTLGLPPQDKQLINEFEQSGYREVHRTAHNLIFTQ